MYIIYQYYLTHHLCWCKLYIIYQCSFDSWLTIFSAVGWSWDWSLDFPLCVLFIHAPLFTTFSTVGWSWDWSLDFPLHVLFIQAHLTHHLCCCKLVGGIVPWIFLYMYYLSMLLWLTISAAVSWSVGLFPGFSSMCIIYPCSFDSPSLLHVSWSWDCSLDCPQHVLFIHGPWTHHLFRCRLVVVLFPRFSSTCIIYPCSLNSPSLLL